MPTMLPRTWACARACSALQSTPQQLLPSAFAGITAVSPRRSWRSEIAHLDNLVQSQQAHQHTRRQYTTRSGSPSLSPSASNKHFQGNNTSASDANSDDRETSEKLRKVLRKVPFPVVVVSTASPHDSSLRRGITVSSFTSISLQPIPLIAFCVKLPSRASTVLHESDRFVVQFLAADQIPHSVAFSSSVSPPPSYSTSTLTSTQPQQQESRSGRSTRAPGDKDTEELVSEASKQTLVDSVGNVGQAAAGKPGSTDRDAGRLQATTDPDPFEVLGYETDAESSLPVLLNTLGAVRCRTHQVMVVGDHEMWIGHVEKVLHGEIPSPGQEPLLYHDRSYRKVGRRIL